MKNSIFSVFRSFAGWGVLSISAMGQIMAARGETAVTSAPGPSIAALNWFEQEAVHRPSFPRSYKPGKSVVPMAVKNAVQSFAVEDGLAKKHLPGVTGALTWTLKVDESDERLAESEFSPTNGVAWKFAVYTQLGNPVPYYWSGMGYPAFDGENVFQEAEKRARAVLCGTNDVFTLSAATNVLVKSDVEISMLGGDTVELPFDRTVFLFIDDRPNANWSHPCRYVFFNESLTEFVVSYQLNPPRIKKTATGARIRLKLTGSEVPQYPSLEQVKNAVYSKVAGLAENSINYAGDVSKSHFVLISGGVDPESNGIRFWADTAMMYSTLTLKYKVPKSQIHVYVSDGTSSANDANLATEDNPVLVSSPTDLDGDGYPDVDGAATESNVSSVFATLKNQLSSDNQLIVFITSHGSSDGTAGSNNYDCLAWLFSTTEDAYFSDSDLHNWTKDIACPVAFAIETCYSGGFIDDITQTANRVIATACNHYESSWGLGGGGAWGTGGAGQTSAYNRWAMPFVTALRGCVPKTVEASNSYPWQDGTAYSADSTGDGLVSFAEAAKFAKANDARACTATTHTDCSDKEHPQFAESTSGLSTSFFTLKQGVSVPTISLSISFDANGGTSSSSGTLPVSSKAYKMVSSSSQPSWVTSLYCIDGNNNRASISVNSGVGLGFSTEATVYATVSANSGTSNRSWSFMATNLYNQITITISQAKATSSFTVSFSGNGASGGTSPSSISDSSGGSVTIPSCNTLYRTGYAFTGWNTSSSGNGTFYCVGSSLSLSADVTLFAQWVPTTTLALALDNSSISFTTGGDAGWYGQTAVSQDGSDAAHSGLIGHSQSSWMQTTVTGPGTISFYWKVSSESVNWDPLSFSIDGMQTNKIGGTSSSWTQQSYTLPAGTHTLKWLYSKDSSNSYGFDCGWVDQVIWSQDHQTVTVSFNGNGGSASSSSQTYTVGSTYGSLPTATRTGYSFTGWFTAASGGTQIYTGSTVSSSYTTLYAHWTQNTLSAALDSGLAFVTGGDASWFGQSGTYYYGGSAAQSGAISASQSTWLRTTVTGPGVLSFYWKVSSESGYDKLTCTDNGSQIEAISGSGSWAQKQVEISSGTHTVVWTYSKDGSNDTGSDCGWVDRVVWSQSQTVTVSFNGNGGSASSSSQTYTVGSTYGSLPTAMRTGYSFTGWFTSASGGTQIYTSSTVSSSYTTLYAHWTQNSSSSSAVRSYSGSTVRIAATIDSSVRAWAVEDIVPAGLTVANISNSGSWDSANRKVKWGPFFDTTARTLTYTVTGNEGSYTFSGTLSVDGTSVAITGAALITVTREQYHPADTDSNWKLVVNEVTQYGSLWKQGSHQNINYLTKAGSLWKTGESYHDSGSGALSPDTDASRWVAGVKSASAALLSLENVLNTVAPTSVRSVSGATVTVTVNPGDAADAAWATEEVIPAGLSVSGISNSGSWDSANRKVKWGPFFDNEARALSYTVSGASGTYTLSGVTSLNGTAQTTTGTTTVTLSASAVTVTVTFVGNGGTVSQSSVAYTVGSTYGSLPTATRTGYSFAGWFTAASGGTQITAGSTVSSSYTTLYAQWSQNSDSSAVRSFSGTTVSVAATIGSSVSSWAVEEVIPTGLSVSGISNSGSWDSANRKVKWGPFFDTTARTLTYTVSGNSGTYTFSGVISLDGTSRATTGAQSLTIQSQTTLILSETVKTVAVSAGSYSVSVTANASWSAMSLASWISVVTASGSGNGFLIFTVVANTSTSARAGTIMVTAGGITRQLTVIQSGTVAEPDFTFFKPSDWPSAFYLTKTPNSKVAETIFRTGETIYFNWAVYNSVNGTTNNVNFPLNVSCNGNLLQWIIGQLPGGFYTSVTNYNWSALQGLNAGTYSISVNFNTNAVARESNYANNSTSVTFTVVNSVMNVSFNGNGGTPSQNSMTYTIGSTYGSLPTAERTGCTFAGWFTAADGGTQVFSSSTVMLSYTVLYAHWLAGLNTALDSTLTFTTGGNADWFGQTSKSYYGGSAAQSGKISDLQATWMQTTVTGPGTVSFYWFVSSESVYADYLNFSIDNVPIKKIGGRDMSSWAHESFSVATGTHTLKWLYRKDTYAKQGSDCGWVDKIVWTPQQTISVSFIGNGGLVSLANASYEAGTSFASLPTATRSGYTFAGWYTAAIGGSHVLATTTVDASYATLYAHWTTGTQIVVLTFNGNGGATSIANRSYLVGSSYGTLPTATWGSAYFRGWYTDPVGGSQVTSINVVSPSVAEIFAHWDFRDQYSSSTEYLEEEGDEDDTDFIGGVTYDGWLWGGKDSCGENTSAMQGTVQIKAAKIDMSRQSRLSAKVTMLGAKVSLKGIGSVDEYGICSATLTGRGKTMTVYLSGDRIWGGMDGLTLDGARNVFLTKNDSRAPELSYYSGTWTCHLQARAVDGAGYAMSFGYSTLSINIGTKGKAKVTGMMADGTKVSASSQLVLVNAENGCHACVPIFVQMYSGKRGGMGCLLWLSDDGSYMVSDWDIYWNANSSKTPFEAKLTFYDGGKLISVSSELYFSFDDYGNMPQYNGASPLSDFFPSYEAVTTGLRWTTAKAGKVASDGSGYTGENPSGLKLTYASKTGLFKGSFYVYYLVNNKLKKVKEPIYGALVNGYGYGTAVVNKTASLAVYLVE